MKIAAITITLNDDFKFNEWVGHYNEYKQELYKHIIIDNGSEPEYLAKVKSAFKDSIIIERQTNGGCTIAYNDGIRLALEDEEVDSIMLVGNDIRLPDGNATELHKYLFSDPQLGMAGPVLLKKDSNKVEWYGSQLKFRIMYCPEKNTFLEHITIAEKYVPVVLGGMNLAKREFYERVGLQDENLFMYGDEQDMAIRSGKNGFKLGVTTKSISWHQHINPFSKNTRSTLASFLSARNYVYLLKKHDNVVNITLLTLFFCALKTGCIIKNISNKEAIIYHAAAFKGLWYGIRGNMDNSFIDRA